MTFGSDKARLTAGLGTRPENVDRALKAMRAAIREFPTEAVTEDDILKLVKKRTGRVRMRQITRMGQAFALTMDVLHGRDFAVDSGERHAAILEVTPARVVEVAHRYLAELPLVTVIAR